MGKAEAAPHPPLQGGSQRSCPGNRRGCSLLLKSCLPASFLASQQSGSPARCLLLLDWKAARACDVTGGRAKTLMVAGPSCSSLSCTSACGMQQLPTHNPSSSPPSVCPEPDPSPHVSVPQQPGPKPLAARRARAVSGTQPAGRKGCLPWGGVCLQQTPVNLIPPLLILSSPLSLIPSHLPLAASADAFHRVLLWCGEDPGASEQPALAAPCVLGAESCAP